ncbi:hypothetical protein [Kribbella antibiotica]|uniref:hypothetical protein n=1 Tax=Kribbella antibiotica TaxID=190195 RepID=UPI001EDF6FA2|nr:hypothetical protein [Kribbella antibiotica]
MDDSELVRAIEDNTAELLMAMGAAGGGSQRDDATARWTIGGSPLDYHNAVVAAAVTWTEPSPNQQPNSAGTTSPAAGMSARRCSPPNWVSAYSPRVSRPTAPSPGWRSHSTSWWRRASYRGCSLSE